METIRNTGVGRYKKAKTKLINKILSQWPDVLDYNKYMDGFINFHP